MTSDTDKDKRRSDKTAEEERDELVAAVLLGLAAIAIAFSAYQSALWGGVQDENLTLSVQQTNAAVDAYQRADTTLAFDQTLFIDAVVSRVCEDDPLWADDFACGQILEHMSSDAYSAYEIWLENDKFSPFDNEAYFNALYSDGDLAVEESDLFFTDAQTANGNGDEYELASTFLTMVLFFAGVSLVVRGARVRMTLIVTSALVLAGSLAYVSTLERTF